MRELRDKKEVEVVKIPRDLNMADMLTPGDGKPYRKVAKRAKPATSRSSI